MHTSESASPEPVAVGEPAPSFQGALGTDGNLYSLASFDDKAIVIVVFMANRCTTAQAYSERLISLQDDYEGSGVQIVAVNSDDPKLSPSETYLEMVRAAKERGYDFPYLKDDDGSIARRYGAQLTLHAFLLDQERTVRYHGRVDDSPNPAFIRVNELRNAIDDVLAGREVRVKETMPFPCGVDKFTSCPSCGSRLEL